MSGGIKHFELCGDDLLKFLACQVHVGSANANFQQEQYVYTRRPDGTHIINPKKTYEKLLLAARAIAAVPNPEDVVVVSARPHAQRALFKYAAHTGATPIFGRFTPGLLTNQIQKTFKQPRLLIVSDPRVDFQAIREASYVNVPVISFCNTDSPMKLVDIAIPCNNKGQQSIGLMWWFLAREVLTLRGKISRESGFILDENVVMPDLYFFRDPEEEQKEVQVALVDETVKLDESMRDLEPIKFAELNAPEPGDWGAAAPYEGIRDPAESMNDWNVPADGGW
ncbi:hypothetical protein L596_008523 [Steinernema carpocapsae]|uniref:Small ribosomal subunit protein uS2 n=1 Tax=Steinernema carpocapsae TaxID=34508 RepID=A0A4U5PD15_STECR|nr:hypothetical protein L596_008523 [Steinernema carpocapsae]